MFAISIVGNRFNITFEMTEILSILKSPHVHMKNELSVLEKINGIISQGADKLQFITDFDRTITKQHDNGKKSLHSFGVFFQSKKLPQSSMNVIRAALAKYDTMEFDPKVDTERKKQITNELYLTVHEQLQGFEFDQQEIMKVISKHGPPFRDRTDELFLELKQLGIPVVIFSAGLEDVIIEQLNQEHIPHDDMNIIANRLKFNGTMLDGLQNHENIVTALNKHEHLSRNVDPEIFKSRKNIILMGDHIGDASMVREFENEEIVLKIGFFYNQSGDALEIFKDTFDIVLNDDQTMNVILEIVELLR